CGSEESLDVRRARALGEIARQDQSLPIASAPEESLPGTPTTGTGRRMQLILHLNADALAPLGSSGALGRCENTRTPVSAEQIRQWCGSPGTRVTVQPV